MEDFLADASYKTWKYKEIEKIDDCMKDDVFRFNRDGSFTMDPGKNPCPNQINEMTTGSWKIDSVKKILYLNIKKKENNNDSVEFKIKELSPKHFTYETNSGTGIYLEWQP